MAGCSQMPPKTGWLFYLDEKWRDAEALCVTVNAWDNEGISKECSKYKQRGIHNPNFPISRGGRHCEVCIQWTCWRLQESSKGDYTKTSQMIKGFPVFEQAEKQEGGKQYFLFVGPDGCWGWDLMCHLIQALF